MFEAEYKNHWSSLIRLAISPSFLCQAAGSSLALAPPTATTTTAASVIPPAFAALRRCSSFLCRPGDAAAADASTDASRAARLLDDLALLQAVGAASDRSDRVLPSWYFCAWNCALPTSDTPFET